MKILCLLPHVDDEIGCLPFIAHKEAKGPLDVYMVYFSKAEKSCKALGFAVESFLNENKKVLAAFDIDLSNVIYYDYPVRDFLEHRQEILENLIQLKKKEKIDLVLCPSQEDVHQDHAIISQEAIRAFKNDTTILGFSYPWNCLEIKNNIFYELTEEMVQKIISTLQCYETQKTRKYMKAPFMKAVFQAQGIHIGKDYAASYKVIKSVNYL